MDRAMIRIFVKSAIDQTNLKFGVMIRVESIMLENLLFL